MMLKGSRELLRDGITISIQAPAARDNYAVPSAEQVPDQLHDRRQATMPSSIERPLMTAHEPKFNPLAYPTCLSYPIRLASTSWAAHVPFAMLLVGLMRPHVIVELGTFTGVSYCAFCQAAKELQLDTRCFAIDTWQGDEQSGFYDGAKILKDLREHHDPLYGAFSALIQSTFDEALTHFEDGAIDLLHIDGYHSYDSVSHDFQSWLPKMSARGVVLFHDINVRERDFGVWKLWEEIKPRYPYFEFIHEHGLGVLAVGADHNGLRDFLEAPERDATMIREFFNELGQRLKVRLEKDQDIEAVAQQIQDREQEIKKLSQELATGLEVKEHELRTLASQLFTSENAAHTATARLTETETELRAIKSSRAWRLVSLYGRIKWRVFSLYRKYKYCLWPVYRLLKLSARKRDFDEKPESFQFALIQLLQQKLNLFLSQHESQLVFPNFPEPLVSILISTFNKAEYLYQCLETILAHTDTPFEVIIVDDCSSDAAIAQLTAKLVNVQTVRNDTNSGFIKSCNKGAQLAKGRYILLLNNDVMVMPQWLSPLVETIERYPQCGAVGGKLVRPDGTLQEAGSIVWQDGSALGYGRDDNPSNPQYCYVREVDFVSGAYLMVRADDFRKLRGFDKRYAPAYSEDADLCMGIRKLGRKVVYQPQATIVHYEYGTHSMKSAIALCEKNQPEFKKKWASVLSQQLPNGNVLRGRDRREGKRVLVINDQIPAPHLGSGLPRDHKMLEYLAELGYVVTFVPTASRAACQPTTDQLQQMGVELLYGDTFNIEEFILSRAGLYDIVIIGRPHNGERFLGLARQAFPQARLIYDAEALFANRTILQAEVEGRPFSDAKKKKLIEREIDLISGGDLIIAVSDAEREVILKEKPNCKVIVWGFAHDCHPPATGFSERRDLLFVGGFMRGHPPNTDAVLHFAEKLFPRIRQELPDARFVIAGSEPSEAIQCLASQDIVVTGFVSDLSEYYEKCRVFVVPLRFGAGVNYKLTEAMSYGIPSVVSALAASPLNIKDGREALVGNNDDEFINKVIRLYQDETLWHSIQTAERKYIEQHCCPNAMKKKLADILQTACNGRKR